MAKDYLGIESLCRQGFSLESSTMHCTLQDDILRMRISVDTTLYWNESVEHASVEHAYRYLMSRREEIKDIISRIGYICYGKYTRKIMEILYELNWVAPKYSKIPWYGVPFLVDVEGRVISSHFESADWVINNIDSNFEEYLMKAELSVWNDIYKEEEFNLVKRLFKILRGRFIYEKRFE